MGAAASPDTMKAQVHDVIANDEHTVVLGTAVVAAPSGASVEYNYVNVFPTSSAARSPRCGGSPRRRGSRPDYRDEFAAAAS